MIDEFYAGNSKYFYSRTFKIQNVTCKNCGNKNSLELLSFTSYFHVFFIPFVSEGRQSQVVCRSCEKEYDLKIQPERIKEIARSEQVYLKIPLWHFTGIFLLGSLILAGIYNNQRDNRFDDMYIKAPMAGDSYEFEDDDGFYSLFKINFVTIDSVFIVYNNKAIDQSRDLDKIDKTKNYSPILIGLSRIELEEMYDNGDILEINRY